MWEESLDKGVQEEKQFVILSACKQSRSKAFLKAFVILSRAKDLVAERKI